MLTAVQASPLLEPSFAPRPKRNGRATERQRRRPATQEKNDHRKRESVRYFQAELPLKAQTDQIWSSRRQQQTTRPPRHTKAQHCRTIPPRRRDNGLSPIAAPNAIEPPTIVTERTTNSPKDLSSSCEQ